MLEQQALQILIKSKRELDIILEQLQEIEDNQDPRDPSKKP